MQIEYLGIEDIHPYENNPRNNDGAVDSVAESIRQFGFKQPIVVDRNGVIVAGHTRYKAAEKLGMKTVPCIRADDLTDEEVRKYRLVDNKSAELSFWDDDKLALELDDLDLDGFDFDWGIELEEEEEEAQEDDFEFTAEDDLPAKAKVGDIYQLGRHRLICGDSTIPETLETLMDGKTADLLLTDPPYGVDYTGKTADHLKMDNDTYGDKEFVDFLTAAFSSALAVTKPGAVFYIWFPDMRRTCYDMALANCGERPREVLVWEKNVFTLGRQDYQWKHEPCLYGEVGGPEDEITVYDKAIYGWKDGASHVWNNDRRQSTVLKFDRPTRSAEHPTMKPVPLFDYLMKNSSNPGDLVLDPFAGSGTTLITAEQNGRTAYCVELDPKYVDVIIERYESLTGQEAEKIA